MVYTTLSAADCAAPITRFDQTGPNSRPHLSSKGHHLYAQQIRALAEKSNKNFVNTMMEDGTSSVGTPLEHLSIRPFSKSPGPRLTPHFQRRARTRTAA